MGPNFKFKLHWLMEERDQPAREVIYHYFIMFMSEFLATAELLFGVCHLLNEYAFKESLFGIAFLTGVLIAMIVQLHGAISGGHINPAVTLSFYLFGRMSVPMALTYIVAQSLGALTGLAFLILMSPRAKGNDPTFCACIIPSDVHPGLAFVWEFFGMAFVILVLWGMLDPRNEGPIMQAFSVKVGLLFTIVIYMLAPYTSAGLNPARSLAPAIYYNNWNGIWVFLAGPTLGSICASLFYHIFYQPYGYEPMGVVKGSTLK